MTDLAYTIAQTDLSNATKEELKNFVKAIRESWGKVIDLRQADAIALRQYLEDYLTAQASDWLNATMG
jgi:ABC-type nitrate/sulfonate/bicarbonate transport system substrate-binding protein